MRHASTVLYQHSSLTTRLMLGVTAAMATGFLSTPACALPQGASVASGQVSFNQPNASQLNIIQSTNKAIIDWNSFDIGTTEATRFYQPGAQSIALNRIHSGNASQILGSLTANGQVMIVNPNGVFFGKNSQVNVAGLVASTADITDQNFNAGHYQFTTPGRKDASIVNQGNITATQGGLVALVAPGVQNDGVISAKKGTVHLASGDAVTVDMYGDGLYSFAVEAPAHAAAKDQNGNALEAAVVNNGIISAQGGAVYLTARAASDVVSQAINNTGVIEATSASIDKTGAILLDGGNGAVNIAGTLDASGKDANQKGGDITVTGKDITLTSNATLDASGSAGGGHVHIGGERQGKGTLAHANTVTTAAGSKITVDATDQGNGGEAIVWSDGTTKMDGTILARGGVQGGNGGFVETSGHELGVNGSVDASASKGNKGQWLLDPDFLVWGGPSISGLSINNASLSASLTGTDVSLAASTDFLILSNVTWNGIGSLTATAGRDLFASANVISNGSGNINFIAGRDVIQNALAVPVQIHTNTGSLTVSAGRDVTVGNSILGNASITSTSAPITLSAGNALNLGRNLGSANVSSATGDIKLTGNSITLLTGASGPTSVTTGGTISADSGSFTLTNGSKLTGNRVDINNSGVFFSDTASVIKGTTAVTLRQTNAGSIENAISAVNAASGLTTLTLANGVYDETVRIIGRNNFTLQGSGNTILRPTSPGSAVPVAHNIADLAAESYNGVVFLENGDHLNITNLTVDGALIGSPVGVTSHSDVIYNNAGGTLSNVTLLNGGRVPLFAISDNTFGHTSHTVTANHLTSYYTFNGITTAEAAGDLLTFNITSSELVGGPGNSGTGLLLQGITGGSIGDGTLANANFIHNTFYGIFLKDSNANSINTNLVASNVGINLIRSSNNTVNSNAIMGANATNNTSPLGLVLNGAAASTGINISNDSSGNSVNSNAISGSYGVRIFGGDKNDVFNNAISASNHVQANGTSVISSGIKSSFGVVLTSTTNTQVRDNFIEAMLGVHNTSVNNTTISNNQITSSLYGIRLADTTQTMIDGNTLFLDNSAKGVLAYGANNQASIINNTFNNGAIGIDATGANTFTLIRNNLFNNNALGIQLNGGSNSTVDSNTLIGVADGIFASNESGLAFTGNHIHGTGHTGTGLWAQLSDGTIIVGNDADHFQDGITLDQSSHISELQNNTASNNSRYGIYATNSDDVQFIHNTAHNNGVAGLALNTGIDSIFARNTVVGGGVGILAVNASGMTIGGATIADANTIDGTQTAIDVANSSDVLIRNNAVMHSVNGISAASISALQLLDNQLSGNAEDENLTGSGISVSLTPEAIIENNQITSFDRGIFLSQSDNGVIQTNTLTGNNNGIVLLNSANAQLSNNDVTGTGTGSGVLIDSSSGTNLIAGTIRLNQAGVELANGGSTVIDGVTLSDNNTGIFARNGSVVTVSDTDFIRGNAGVVLEGPRTSFGFAGNQNTFTGMPFYFILQNGGMNGAILNASAQIFDGTFASDFTRSQLAQAELQTIDSKDGGAVGTVFYKRFDFDSLQAALQSSQSRSVLSAPNFSYEGQTLNTVTSVDHLTGKTIPGNAITYNRPALDVAGVDLSLLGQGVNRPTPITPNVLSALTPAAGGDNPANGQQYNALASAAGSNNCGNNFLGSGFELGYNSANCSVSNR